MLWMFLSLGQIKLLQIFMQLINIWYWLVNNGFAIIFAEFGCQVFFFDWMEKRTDLRFIASKFITTDTFELVGMVESFDSCVAFLTL